MSGRARTIVVGGPDLDRRARIADDLAAALRADGHKVDRHRWPEGGVPSGGARGPGRARGRFRSVLRLVTAVLGLRRAWGRWTDAAGDRGVVVVDGAWADLLLHSRRHGLWAGLIGPGRAVAGLAPRADVVVLADVDGPHPRPLVTTAHWAPWAWGQYAGWVGRSVVVDRGDATATAAAVGAALDRPGAVERLRWVEAPVGRSDRDTRATVGRGGCTALAMPIPTRVAASVATRVNTAFVRYGVAVPTTAPVDGLSELCDRIGIEATGFATFSTPSRGRVTVAVAGERGLRAVLKIGAIDDVGLHLEARALEQVRPQAGAFEVPDLLFGGEWDGQFVVATQAIEHHGVTLPDDDQVVALCLGLARAWPGGGPVVHGDLAPWNLLRTTAGIVVVDWEQARDEDDPMADLVHLVVHAGQWTDADPGHVAARLVGPGGPGTRYLAGLGLDPGTAADHARRHLGDQPDGYRDRVLERLGR